MKGGENMFGIKKNLTQREKVLKAIGNGKKTPSQIARKTGLTVTQVDKVLYTLRVKGEVAFDYLFDERLYFRTEV